MQDFSRSRASIETKTTPNSTNSTRLWRRAQPMGWHITMRLADDRVIAHTTAELRLAARVLVEQGRDRGLLSFCVVDTHVHAVAVARERRLDTSPTTSRCWPAHETTSRGRMG